MRAHTQTQRWWYTYKFLKLLSMDSAFLYMLNTWLWSDMFIYVLIEKSQVVEQCLAITLQWLGKSRGTFIGAENLLLVVLETGSYYILCGAVGLGTFALHVLIDELPL